MKIKLTLSNTLPFLIAAALVVAISLYSPKGIIILEGWEHAVALCDGEGDRAKQTNSYATQWNEDGILYVVNKGHEDDPSLSDLKLLAQKECAPYLNQG